MVNVRVATTPDGSVDTSAAVIACAKPPEMLPGLTVLSNKLLEVPVVDTVSPPVLYPRNGPATTFVKWTTAVFQVTVGTAQPQMSAAPADVDVELYCRADWIRT